jgi:hypothetical protein
MDQLLLYTSIGKNEAYINLLELFCDSLCISNPQMKYLLVISDISFHSKIHTILSKYAMLEFFIYDVPDSMSTTQASMNKLKIFEFPKIRHFSTCLFIDLDCLFIDSLDFLFDTPIHDNTLYAYSEKEHPKQNNLECFSLSSADGKYLYYNSQDLTMLESNHKLPFNAGLFLFRISDTMQRHFESLNAFISQYKGAYFFEQSFMNTYFHLNNVSNTEKLNTKNIMMLSNSKLSDISTQKIIHFNVKGVGNAIDKYNLMNMFWKERLEKQSKKIILYPTRNEMITSLISNRASILEIGVFKGTFAQQLAKLSPRVLHLVDIWETGPMVSGDHDGNNIERIENASIFYTYVKHHFRFFPNVNVHRMKSTEFLSLMKPNSLDIIYIDGDHSYEGVKADLEASLPIIRKYGYIMGHDYEMNMEKAKRSYDFGVKRAVDEFCLKYSYSICAKGNDGCVSYAIFINHK